MLREPIASKSFPFDKPNCLNQNSSMKSPKRRTHKPPVLGMMALILVVLVGVISVFRQLPHKSEVDTANWKTYSGQHFTFQYPSNAVFEEPTAPDYLLTIRYSDPTQHTPEPHDGYVFSAAYLEDIKTSYDDYVKQQYDANKRICRTTAKIGDLQTANLAGMQGKMFTMDNCLYTSQTSEYYFSGPHYVMIVDKTVFATPQNSDKYSSVLNKILSTFQFRK